MTKTLQTNYTNASHLQGRSEVNGRKSSGKIEYLHQRPRHDTLFIEVLGVANRPFNPYRPKFHNLPCEEKHHLLYKHVVAKEWTSKKLNENNIDQEVLEALKADYERKSHYYTVKLNGTRWCDILPFDGNAGDFYQIARQYLKTTYRFSRMHRTSERIDTCIREYTQSLAGLVDMRLNRDGNGNELSEQDALDCCNRLIAFWNEQADDLHNDRRTALHERSKSQKFLQKGSNK